MPESDNGTGDDSDGEEEVVFRCRKCPGKTFTIAEKIVHRQYHRSLKDAERGPGGKRPRRSKHLESPSADESDITLFGPVDREQLALAKKASSQSSEDSQDDSPPSGKRRSRKWYNKSITGNWKKGTGA